MHKGMFIRKLYIYGVLDNSLIRLLHTGSTSDKFRSLIIML